MVDEALLEFLFMNFSHLREGHSSNCRRRVFIRNGMVSASFRGRFRACLKEKPSTNVTSLFLLSLLITSASKLIIVLSTNGIFPLSSWYGSPSALLARSHTALLFLCTAWWDKRHRRIEQCCCLSSLAYLSTAPETCCKIAPRLVQARPIGMGSTCSYNLCWGRLAKIQL